MTRNTFTAESQIHGRGVFAARGFSRGEAVLVNEDSCEVDAQHRRRPETGEAGPHCDYLAYGRVVLMQLPERSINASGDPNTCIRTTCGEGHGITLQPIDVGEGLTCEYIMNCHGGERWLCHCGSGRCRGIIVSSYFGLPLAMRIEILPLLGGWLVGEHNASMEALRDRTSGKEEA